MRYEALAAGAAGTDKVKGLNGWSRQVKVSEHYDQRDALLRYLRCTFFAACRMSPLWTSTESGPRLVEFQGAALL